MKFMPSRTVALGLGLLLGSCQACKNESSQRGSTSEASGSGDGISNADRAISVLDGVAKEMCACKNVACIETIETRLKKSPPPILKELAGGGTKGSTLTEAQQANIRAIGTAAQACIDAVRPAVAPSLPPSTPAEATAPAAE